MVVVIWGVGWGENRSRPSALKRGLIFIFVLHPGSPRLVITVFMQQ